MTVKVVLKSRLVPRLLAYQVPKSVLGVKPWLLKPRSFTSDVPGLKPVYVDGNDQLDGLTAFMSTWPPSVFCIGGAPNDRRAKALAAYMVQAFIESHPRRPPVWNDLYGGFKNDLLDNVPSCGMLVLCNLTPESTAPKVEKCRDLLEKFCDVPRVLVVAGTDPMTYINKYLHYPVAGCAYLATNIVRADVEL